VTPFNNWNPGEPNNAGGEDYAQFVSSGLWNDLPDWFSLPYVIEFDYVVTYSAWVLETTVYTDAAGRYVISQPTNPSVERYIELSSIPVATVNSQQAKAPYPVILGSQQVDSKNWYLWDVNNDGRVNVTDSYYLHAIVSGRFTSFATGLPVYRLFTPAQFNVINGAVSDQRVSNPGVQTFTISSPASGGTSNFYLFRTGYPN